jgi:hypothetical protein
MAVVRPVPVVRLIPICYEARERERLTSHSRYITHLPYHLITMVATRLLSRNLARQSIALRKPVRISSNQKVASWTTEYTNR